MKKFDKIEYKVNISFNLKKYKIGLLGNENIGEV